MTTVTPHTVPLKRVIRSIQSGVSVNAVDTPAGPGELGVLKTSCVYSGSFDPLENKAVLPEEAARVACPVTANTLVVSRMNTPDLVGAAGLARQSLSTIFLPDRLWQVSFDERSVSPRFVYWWTRSSLYRDQVRLACAGASSSMQNLDQDSFRAFQLPAHSVGNQERIANFLDEKTARIDALIAEKERLLAHLKESAWELLHHAVTKGSRRLPTKDSGRAWMGPIPSHWEAPYIRFVARLESGHTPSRQHPEYWVDCNIPWFSLADVWQIRSGRIEAVTETAEKVSELGIANSSARLLPAGTVMLSRTASVGFSAMMGVPMATTQDFANWVCGTRILPEFLLYVLRAMVLEFERLKFGSTHATIYMPDIARLSTPLPPIDEQRDIVTAIRRDKMRLDELCEVAAKSADTLREYRSSLISAAVTGQFTVPG